MKTTQLNLTTLLTTMALLLCACQFDLNDNDDDSNEETKDVLAQTKDTNWFTLAVIPDTQKYSRYSPERFYAQTQWIADNYKTEKIKFTVHLGDIVDRANEPAEWDVARTAMGHLDDNPETPYSILAGNHDVLNASQFDDKRDQTKEPYLQYFSPETQASRFDTFQGANANGWNSYHIFTADDGQQFLVFALDWKFTYWNPAWGETDTKMTLEWVKNILAQHPNLPAIITTHQALNIADDGKTAVFTDKARLLWNYVIRDNDQVFLVLNGHHHGEAVMEASNKYGRKVIMAVVDYQSGFWGGDGMMQLIRFNKTDNQLEFRSYSPYVDALDEDLRQDDQEVSRWEFNIAMDFNARFNNFNPKNADGSDQTSEAGNIAGTRAYWVLDSAHIVGEDIEEVMDASGNSNTLTVASDGTVTGKQSDFIKLTDAKPPFGYAQGSVHFNGRQEGGYYLTNSADNITTETTAAGLPGYMANYTIEASFRLPEDWTAERARWSGILNNIANISTVCSHHSLNCSSGDPALTMAISNLEEVQWVSVSANGKGSDSFSWDLNTGQWYHVAITNDGKKTLMYINGALVMRTGQSEQAGLLIRKGDDWRIGISSWDGADADPFYGDIAEVRIVNRVLPQEEWIYFQNNTE